MNEETHKINNESVDFVEEDEHICRSEQKSKIELSDDYDIMSPSQELDSDMGD